MTKKVVELWSCKRCKKFPIKIVVEAGKLKQVKLQCPSCGSYDLELKDTKDYGDVYTVQTKLW